MFVAVERDRGGRAGAEDRDEDPEDDFDHFHGFASYAPRAAWAFSERGDKRRAAGASSGSAETRGAGRGAFFTSLEWFRDQFHSAIGFRPFPGTLNVRICDDDLPQLNSFLAKKDHEI
ncbi:CTP-dependent riboflavin kinase, partial [bacterium]|nr:CTP-dependent riboflavin kinase [bacterium]